MQHCIVCIVTFLIIVPYKYSYLFTYLRTKRHFYVCIYLCCFNVNSVRNREPTARSFTLDGNWRDIEAARSKKKIASGRRNTAGARKQNGGTTASPSVTPTDQLSSQRPGSQVTVNEFAVSRDLGRKDANKTASRNRISSSASRQNSAVSSKSADKAKRSAESKAGFSDAHAVGRKPSSTSITNGGRKDATKSFVSNPTTDLRDPGHHNSAARDAARARCDSKSQTETLAAETGLRETHCSSVTTPSNASNTPNNVETASLHDSATGPPSLSTRSRKTSANKKIAYSIRNNARDMNLNGSGVQDRTPSEVRSIQLLPTEGTVSVGSSAATGNSSAVKRFSSTVAVSQPSVARPSSEAMDAVVTSGKTIVTSQLDAASARTRSVIQSRRTATNTQTSSSEAVAGNQANTNVMSSGKTAMTNGSNQASSKTRSVTRGKQTSATSVTASAVASTKTQHAVR